MADKTGMEALIPTLESLYLDYLAYRHIARTAEPQRWAIHLNDYRKAKRFQVAPQFDAVFAILQNSFPADVRSYDECAQKVADLLLEGMLS